MLDIAKVSKPLDNIFRKGKLADYLDEIEKDPDRWGCFLIHRDLVDDEEDDEIYDRRIHLIVENCFRQPGNDLKVPLHLGKISL